MTSLRKHVVDETLAQVKIVYLDRRTASWWNARRDKEVPIVFCGWYWVRGKEEGGPFKTRSSALRDSYYRYVIHSDLPAIGQQALTRLDPPRPTRRLARAPRAATLA